MHGTTIKILTWFIWLQKYVIEGQIEGRLGVTERRGRRRKQLLDDLMERRGGWNLKEEVLARTVWRPTRSLVQALDFKLSPCSEYSMFSFG